MVPEVGGLVVVVYMWRGPRRVDRVGKRSCEGYSGAGRGSEVED